MGYTHYWKTHVYHHDPTKWDRFIGDVEKLIQTVTGLPFFTESDFEAIVSKEGVMIHGGCESLHISYEITPDVPALLPKSDRQTVVSFHFCKTRQLPYDAIVVATLLLYKKHFGEDVSLSSDGHGDDFKKGKSLLGTIFGYEFSKGFGD